MDQSLKKGYGQVTSLDLKQLSEELLSSLWVFCPPEGSFMIQKRQVQDPIDLWQVESGHEWTTRHPTVSAHLLATIIDAGFPSFSSGGRNIETHLGMSVDWQGSGKALQRDNF